MRPVVVAAAVLSSLATVRKSFGNGNAQREESVHVAGRRHRQRELPRYDAEIGRGARSDQRGEVALGLVVELRELFRVEVEDADRS